MLKGKETVFWDHEPWVRIRKRLIRGRFSHEFAANRESMLMTTSLGCESLALIGKRVTANTPINHLSLRVFSYVRISTTICMKSRIFTPNLRLESCFVNQDCKGGIFPSWLIVGVHHILRRKADRIYFWVSSCSRIFRETFPVYFEIRKLNSNTL